MPARHERYRSVPGMHCNAYAVKKGDHVRTKHTGDEVLFYCRQCGEMYERAYRLPERDAISLKIDKDLIGKRITASRRVAWVGYATDKDTLMLSTDEIDSEIADLVLGVLDEIVERQGDMKEKILKALNGKLAIGARKTHAWLYNAAAYEAVGNLRAKRFQSHRRSLWLVDFDEDYLGRFEGTIEDWVPCQTGEHSPAQYSSGGFYADEYEPAYLYNVVYQQLYVVSSNLYNYYRVINPVAGYNDAWLIHPDDVRLIE